MVQRVVCLILVLNSELFGFYVMLCLTLLQSDCTAFFKKKRNVFIQNYLFILFICANKKFV